MLRGNGNRTRTRVGGLGGGPLNQNIIGGIPVGTAGTAGIYNGYTMVGGDDFNEALSIFNASNPNGKYATTHVYGSGARSVAGGLSSSYDMDPYHTGAQDSNRGVAVNPGNMLQSASVLSINVRTATGGEAPHLNTRPIVAGMIHTGGYLVVNAPCIIESYCAFTTGNPTGYHPTFWTQNAFPLNTNNSAPSPGGFEVDIPECDTDGLQANFNAHGTTIGPANSTTDLDPTLMGSGYHLYSAVLTATDIKYYVDGVLKKTVLQDATNTNRPSYILFTGHTLSPDVSSFAGKPSGGTSSIDYYRVWLPTSASSQVLRPGATLPTQQIDFGGAFSYVFPSSASLWGSGVTDYCQAIKMEDMEPGCSTEGAAAYEQFPSGYSWNSGTRTLTGSVTDRPGRLNLISSALKSGGSLGYVARGYIDVGPNVTTLDLSGLNGTAFSHDLYPECDVGTLLPKVITCTGLPTGLSFSAATGLITGTPTVNGASTVTIGVTNSKGQSSSKDITLTVAASQVLAIDGSVTNTTVSAGAIALTLTTVNTNDIIMAYVRMASGGSVTGITGGGLTWTKRAQGTLVGNTITETWYAKSASALSATSISVAISGTSTARATVFGVSGANFTTPFDTNASLPAKKNGNNSQGNQTISTDHANDMTILYAGSDASLGTVSRPSGFAQVLNTGSSMEICTKVEVAQLSSQTYQISGTGAGQINYIYDCIQGA
jgi:Putative Ig domain